MAYRPLPRPPPIGRYSRRGDERRPAELGRPTPSVNVRTTVVGITDPYSKTGERLLATVNRRTSILEWEESHGRITVGAREAGDWLEDIYEERSRVTPGSPNQEGNLIGGFAKAAAMHGRLAHMLDKTGPEILWVRNGPGGIGELGERLLRHILGDRWTYAECAYQRDKLCGDAGITFVAKSFRNYLEAVADMRAARGRGI